MSTEPLLGTECGSYRASFALPPCGLSQHSQISDGKGACAKKHLTTDSYKSMAGRKRCWFVLPTLIVPFVHPLDARLPIPFMPIGAWMLKQFLEYRQE